MPQARHGGRGVCTFAVATSKFEGIGLEKVHIGHIHVTLLSHELPEGFIVSLYGRGDRCPAEAGESEGTDLLGVYAEFRPWTADPLGLLGYSVILGEDLRKPA